MKKGRAGVFFLFIGIVAGIILLGVCPAAALSGPPTGLATDGKYLFVSYEGSPAIEKILLETGEATRISDPRFLSPTGLATDGTDLFVADANAHTIWKVTFATGEISRVGPPARFNVPMGIVLERGNLFVTARFRHSFAIWKVVLATGRISTVGESTHFGFPTGLASDGTHLFMADPSNNVIEKITLATEKRVHMMYGMEGMGTMDVGGPPGFKDGRGSAARFRGASGVATDGTFVYVADAGNHAIRRVDITTEEVVTIAGDGTPGLQDGVGENARFDKPWTVVLTPDKTRLYVADTGNRAIRRIDLETGAVTTVFR